MSIMSICIIARMTACDFAGSSSWRRRPNAAGMTGPTVRASPRLAQLVALANGAAGVVEIIELADVDAVVAQDVVGGDDVEVEVRQHPVPEVLEPLHFKHQVL